MVALCCVARNENKYLQEWVSYHLKMGFSKIYIYDIGRGGDERCDELAFDERVSVINTFRDYKKKGDVTIESYTHCYKKYGNNFRWMMFLSINEFLVLDNTNNIYDFVNDFTKKVGATQCIRFNWLCYDSNDHKTYEDKDVRLRFTRHAKNVQYNNRYECIYKCKLSNFELINAHCARNLHYSYMCDGTHIGSWMFPTAKNVTYNGGHINCYLTKSEEEYLDSNNRTPLFKSGQGLEFFNAFHDPQCQPIVEKKSATQRTQANSVSVSKGNVDDGGVSICLSAWNTQDYIEECLDSIANQTWFKTHDNWEILLGIDACEKTLAKVKEIMHKYKNLSVYMMNENVGTYVTCNTIMKLAKYEWLLRFDTDDVMLPNMVETMMNKKKDAEFVLFQMKNFGLVNGRDEIQRTYGQHLMKKCVFYRFNGYSNWRCSADDDLIHKVRKYGKVVVIPEVLMKRRLHDSSLTMNKKTNFQSEIRKKYAQIVLDEATYSSLEKCKNKEIASCTFRKICPETIIVSFTSWKKRINRCSHTVDLMLNQTLQPNKIILNLSEDEFTNKEKDLPKDLVEKQGSLFEIYWVKENTKVYKKIIPTLNRFPNDIVISVDDDIEYPSDYIETMYTTYAFYGKRYPIAAFKNKEPNYDIYRHSGGFSLIKCDFFGDYLNDLYQNVVLKYGIDKLENDDDIYFYAMLLAQKTYKLVDDVYLDKIKETYKKSTLLNESPYSIYDTVWRKRREESIRILHTYIKEKYNKTYDELILDTKEKIIVSFTTWKKRQDSAVKMLEYFKKQTLKPDKIYCWLSSDEYGGENTPQCLKRFVNENFIEIKWVKQNTYCYKRYEVFRKHHNDYVFLIDDDIFYDVDYLEKMYGVAKKHQSNVICYLGNSVEYTNERKLLPLKENPSVKNTLLSGLSCYPPHIFPIEYFNYTSIRDKIAPKCDDSFMRSLAIKNNISIFCVYDRSTKDFKSIPNTRNVGIWATENSIKTNGVMKRTDIFKKLIHEFALESKCRELWEGIII